MTWKVSRVGRGTVQTLSQMITREMNFRPIHSGVHSVFGQAMGRGEDEGISLAEELDCSRGFTAAPTAAYVAQTVPRQRVVVARRGAWREVLFCCLIVRLGEVGCMLHGHVELLVVITPLGWGDRGKVLFPEQTGNANDPAAVAFFHGHDSLNPFKHLQRGFPDANAVGGHPDRLIWYKP